jgi:excisionase family DNA binding protein
MESTSESVTAADAAIMLGISRRRVTQLIDEGIIMARKMGDIWVIPRAEVDRARNRGDRRENNGPKVKNGM